MRGKVLVLSWTVPPETTGSAIIVGNLAKQFTREEMVVAGERSWGRPPVAWQEQWPQIVFIAPSLPPGWRGERWWRRFQLPLMILRTWRLAQKHRCESILSVFPKEEPLLTGYLAARAIGARFYPYFHNVYLENRAGVARRFARWLQSRAFRRAAHVFVMSEGMMELYRQRYPDLKCSALLHSFNEPLPQFEPPPHAGRPLRLMVCGSINDSCRDAASRFSRAVRALPETHLTFLTGTPRSELAKAGLLGERIEVETVSRDDVLAQLRTAAIVLLPHGFSGPAAQEEYDTIFPTKTIEYLICGRPILAHAPKESYLARFLRKADCALLVDSPDIDELTVAIRRLGTDSDFRARLVRNALRAAEPFQARKVAAELRAHLNGTRNL